MHKAASHLSSSVIIIPAVPSDAAEAYNSGNKGKWYEFIEAHVEPLRADLREQIPNSMVDPVTEVYRERTPISGSLVSLHWFDLDSKHILGEVLRHQFSDTIGADGALGGNLWQYDKMKNIFCASTRLFWGQASWLALHLVTEYEMDFPFKQAADGYFNVVDPKLAELMFEHAFFKICIDERAPHYAAVKDAYEAKFERTLDVKNLSGFDSQFGMLIEEFVKTCAAYWKMGGYR